MNKSDAVAIIRSLLSSTNGSYSIYRLNKDFKDETGFDIPLYGYGNLGDFLNSIPDTVRVTGFYPIQQVSLVTNEKSAHIVSLVKRQKKNGSRSKFLSNRKTLFRESEIIPRAKEVEMLKMGKEEGAPGVLKLSTSSLFSDNLVPMKCLSWTEESIPVIDVRIHTQVGEYIEVCPCWIFTPEKFYFHLRKFKKKFHDFSKEFQMFYTVHEEIPYMVDDHVQPKKPCAVFHKIFSKANWYRGEIEEISQSSQVIVNFIDYGRTMEISKGNLKYLHQNFQLFPRQAVLGSLANIKPVRHHPKWSLGSIRRFHDLAFEKDLVGGVVYMNDKDGCLGMALSYTGNSEIHINDALVKEGYAEFDVNVSRFNTEGMSNEQSLCETVLRPDINENFHGMLCFFTSDYCNNMRLKKMFAPLKEK